MRPHAARVLCCGTLTLSVLRDKKSGNEQFAHELTAWAFKESLVLRVDGVEHHRENQTEQRETYTTNDIVVCTPFSYQSVLGGSDAPY